MWLNYKSYSGYNIIESILPIAQAELKKYLLTKEPTDMADLKWFEENQYGEPIPEEAQEEMKKWYAIPFIRNRKFTEWAKEMPELAEIAMSLPGVVNFSLNAISPNGTAPTHSDYSYDMRGDLTGNTKVYVILLGVSIPSDDINKCGFHVNEERIVFGTGSIKAFDGATPHGSWNYTKEWRYTINIDLSAEQWNL